MQLSLTNTNFNYSTESNTEIISVSLVFLVSNILGDTSNTIKSCTLVIPYSDFLAQTTNDALTSYIKTQLKNRIDSGQIKVSLSGFDYNTQSGSIVSVNIRFVTKDSDVTNTVAFSGTAIMTPSDFDTARASGNLDGVISSVVTQIKTDIG